MVVRTLQKGLSIFATVLFLLIAVGGITYFVHLSDDARPFAILIALIVFNVSTIWFLVWKIERTARHLRSQVESRDTEISNAILDSISPLLESKVSVCSGIESVIDGITNVYNSASDEMVRRRDEEYLKEKPAVITLFGASDVQAIATRKAGASDVDDTAFDRFVRAQDRAERESVRIERYVRLFDEKNEKVIFQERSEGVRSGYLAWLERQITLLKGRGDYHLFDAKRAPRWKAIRSSVASTHIFVDILGDGESGFSIDSSSFVESQIRNSAKYLRSAESGRGGITKHYSSLNVNELEQHLRAMQKLGATRRSRAKG